MTRRAMTLLETLASLGLLGLLAGASIGWISASQRTLTETAASTTWIRAADATLAMLHDDLVSGDSTRVRGITVEPSPGNDGSPIESIAFPTRSVGVGACEVMYNFDGRSSRLTRSVNDRERLLLGSVSAFEIELTTSRTDPDSPPTEFVARMISSTGEQAERRIRLGTREIAP